MKNSLVGMSLLSRMNPPLPIDRYGAEKLLNLLKSSFQQQLDNRYPTVQSVARSPDRHIFRILSSPLFHMESTRPPSHPSTSQNDGNPRNLARIQTLVHEPLDYFKGQISSGTATLQSAKVCLRFYIQKALTSSNSEPFELLKASNAWPVVESWLWSSGMKKAQFLKDEEFCALIIPFLVFEGREEVIWDWVQSLIGSIKNSNSDEERIELLKIQSKIIFERLRFEIIYGKGLDSAVQIFTQRAIKAAGTKTVLQKSVRFLIGGFVKRHQESTTGTQPLIATIQSWSTWPDYHRAVLNLYTNEHPDASFAIQLLQTLDEKRQTSLLKWNRPRIIALSIRSAEVLLSKNLVSDATWVMQFLRNNFAEDINSLTQGETDKRANKGHGADEESSLQSLDTLVAD